MPGDSKEFHWKFSVPSIMFVKYSFVTVTKPKNKQTHKGGQNVEKLFQVIRCTVNMKTLMQYAWGFFLNIELRFVKH